MLLPLKLFCVCIYNVLEESLLSAVPSHLLAFLYHFVFSASPGQVTFFFFRIAEAHYCKYSVLVLTKQTGLLKSKLLLVYLPSLLILLATGSVVELLVYTSCLKKI